MKEFLVKTNYGYTYKWTAQQVAQDYADIAIQWQHEDDVKTPKTKEELYTQIFDDEEWLETWFNEQIADDLSYIKSKGELVEKDDDEYLDFIDFAILNWGRIL